MNEKPRCPYCNAEMYPNEPLGGQRFYSCRICGACSPRRSGAKAAYKAALDRIPAAPQPMSAVEYLAAEQRMCFDENVGKINCSTCPLSSRINPARINCGDYTREHPEVAVAIVQKWAQEHPEEVNDED